MPGTTYATPADMIAAFGLDEMIAVTDRTGTGQVDAAVALEALERASSEAESYLAARYPLPLATVPQALAYAVCDMARYRLTGGAAQETESIAERHRAAVAWLRDVAAGRAVLPGALPPAQGGGGVAIDAGHRHWMAAPEGGNA